MNNKDTINSLASELSQLMVRTQNLIAIQQQSNTANRLPQWMVRNNVTMEDMSCTYVTVKEKIITKLVAEIEGTEAALLNPASVLHNMLVGKIVVPSLDAMIPLFSEKDREEFEEFRKWKAEKSAQQSIAHHVPDHCDRIVYKDRYYHLSHLISGIRWQYYYKNNNCKAFTNPSDSESCTCWHDAGTGPFKERGPYDGDGYLEWRQRPIK